MRLTDAEKDLVDNMMQIDPTKRLGGSKEGMKDLKAHAYFEGVDFEAISQPDCQLALPMIDILKELEKKNLDDLREANKKKPGQPTPKGQETMAPGQNSNIPVE